MEEYKEVFHRGYRCLVNKYGDVYSENKTGQLVHREWRYNHDGYPVVTASHRTKKAATIQVHILVAKAFVVNLNPIIFTEVNHIDFNRANPCADNLEWVTHYDNVQYSVKAGHYIGKFGQDNPNYGNHKLHKKYSENTALSKEKQSRPRGQNGRALSCFLTSSEYFMSRIAFNCQKDAVDWLINMEYIPLHNREYLIKQLKKANGYYGWHLSNQ